jgi:magnesium transporter
MITYYFRTVKDAQLKTVPEFRTGVWVHAESPTEAELQHLITTLNLDDNIVEDVQDFFEVPRQERSEGITYLFTRYPFAEEVEDTDTAPLLFVLGENFLLTIAQREVPQFDKFTEGKAPIITTQKIKLFIELMEAITHSFERQLVLLRKAVHRDRARLRRIGNREIVRFVAYEHKLNDFVAAAVPTSTAIQQITKANHIQLFEEDRELMEDLMVDTSQLVDSARSVLKTIQNVRSATESILANNLNSTIKTLTLFTILLTIPTIIASLFGMNVQLPLQENPFGFWIVLGLIGVGLGITVMIFKKNDWL